MCALCPRQEDVAITLEGLEGREFLVCGPCAQFVADMHMSLMDAFPMEQGERSIIGQSE